MITGGGPTFGDSADWLNEIRTARYSWHPDELGLVADAGDIGGDIQVGPAYSIRFVREDMPNSLVTVSIYATDQNNDDPARRGEEYGWDGQVEYLTCTDPSDPGGTETWSDIRYLEGSVLASETLELADSSAQGEAGMWLNHGAEWIAWDGEPFTRTSFAHFPIV